ncbi:hypothetical protein E4Z66_01740 [Aliishimia ponticola]|uniref:DUF7742 domain-containing protein n=2 Tax=Aliishimia ponticola TaxID=2499833 RepID=A0A4S4NFJ9_9RHOB|nr:hypothetical protein E4Z66_01740 [Aliishimia ponticola]
MLLAQPREQRGAICRRAFREAEIADRYRIQHRTRHPAFGDGSLAGWAAQHPRLPEPRLDDPDYAGCLRLVLGHLMLQPGRADRP